jgi:hypothetical protein
LLSEREREREELNWMVFFFLESKRVAERNDHPFTEESGEGLR